jgi:hypothetical protein
MGFAGYARLGVDGGTTLFQFVSRTSPDFRNAGVGETWTGKTWSGKIWSGKIWSGKT